MKPLQRLAAMLLALVGGVGFVMCVAAIVFTWSTARSLKHEVPHAIEQLETVGIHVRTHGDAAVQVVGTTRARLASILVTIEELSERPEDRPEANVFDRLDAEVVDRLERAKDFVRSLQDGLDSAGRAMMMLESVPLIGLQSRRSPPAGESNTTKLSSNLSDISKNLDQLLEALSTLEARRSLEPADIQRLQSALREVDTQLERVQSDLSLFSSDAGALVDRLDAVKVRSGKTIQQVAIAGTLFLICFGCTQLHLLIAACRMLRHPPDTTPSSAGV
jgi:hypothetical protein